jgi:hypothetical protein
MVSSALKENISIPNNTVFEWIVFGALIQNEDLKNKTYWTSLNASANAKPLTLYF